jgi:hypothetical protein
MRLPEFFFAGLADPFHRVVTPFPFFSVHARYCQSFSQPILKTWFLHSSSQKNSNKLKKAIVGFKGYVSPGWRRHRRLPSARFEGMK